jgi:hypothetical protein
MKTDLKKALDEIELILHQRVHSIPGCETEFRHISAKEVWEAIERDGLGDRFNIQWKRGWGVRMSLQINFKAVPNTRHERDGETPEIWAMEQEMSWSASSYNINAAISQAALIRDVAELAAILQTVWEQYRVQKGAPVSDPA